MKQRESGGKVGKKGSAKGRQKIKGESVEKGRGVSSGAHQSRGTRELSRVKPRKLNPGLGKGEINACGLLRQRRVQLRAPRGRKEKKKVP